MLDCRAWYYLKNVRQPYGRIIAALASHKRLQVAKARETCDFILYSTSVYGQSHNACHVGMQDWVYRIISCQLDGEPRLTRKWESNAESQRQVNLKKKCLIGPFLNRVCYRLDSPCYIWGFRNETKWCEVLLKSDNQLDNCTKRMKEFDEGVTCISLRRSISTRLRRSMETRLPMN